MYYICSTVGIAIPVFDSAEKMQDINICILSAKLLWVATYLDIIRTVFQPD